MQCRHGWLFGFVAGVLTGLVTGPVGAQTVANGPYYATPSWDQTLPPSTRFIVLANMNNEAVLDRETGVVWELTVTVGPAVGFIEASTVCATSRKGNRRGWRLPSIDELTSVFDANSGDPPAGHPFVFGAAVDLISASISPIDGRVWGVIRGGSQLLVFRALPASLNASVWCVRGPAPGGVSP
jgi:hypothetical protein